MDGRDDPVEYEKVGYGAAQQKAVERFFYQQLTQGETNLTPKAFVRVLGMLGVPETECPGVFRSFDTNCTGQLGFDRFLRGVVAMDPRTPHDGHWGLIRLKYIFRLYDSVPPHGQLSFDEFKLMIKHLQIAHHKEHDTATVEKVAASHSHAFHTTDRYITEATFVEAVTSHQFRGSSKLFRFPRSPLHQTPHPQPSPSHFPPSSSSSSSSSSPPSSSSSSSSSPPSSSSSSSSSSSLSPSSSSSSSTSFSGSAASPNIPHPNHHNPRNNAAATVTPPHLARPYDPHTPPYTAATPARSRDHTPASNSSSQFHHPSSQLQMGRVVIEEQAIAINVQSNSRNGSRVVTNHHGGKLAWTDSEGFGGALRKVSHFSVSLTPFKSAPSSRSEELALEVSKEVVNRLLVSKPFLRPDSNKFGLLNEEALTLLCGQARTILASESSCEEVRAPVKVFGDIHGQLLELQQFFDEYGSPNSYTGDVNFCTYVFNGDFVDRGPHSLEVVCLLLACKVLYPGRIYLLRGNHEDRAINRTNGFFEECRRRCGAEPGARAWEVINTTFDYLPVAARVDGKILIVHGGVGRDLQTVAQIKAIPRPIAEPQSHPLLLDVMWSDPTQNDRVMGVHASARGKSIVTFGPDRVHTFCRDNNLDLIIRSHQCVMEGYEFFANGHLMTVFSATNYQGRYENDGAMLEVYWTAPSTTLCVVPKVVKAVALNLQGAPG